MDFYRGTDHDVRDSVSLHAETMGAGRHLDVTPSFSRATPNDPSRPQRSQSAPRARSIPRRSLRAQRSIAFLGGQWRIGYSHGSHGLPIGFPDL